MFGSLNPTQWLKFTNAASVLVKKASGNLTGITCAQSSSWVISVYDSATIAGAAAGNIILDSIPLTAGNPVPIPAQCRNGIVIVTVSGTGSAAVFYD